MGIVNDDETYVDRPEAGTMPGSHILVEALDGVSTSEFTELLVHVVGAGARVVTEPDAEVLDLQGLLLVNLSEFRPRKKARERCSQPPIPPAT